MALNLQTGCTKCLQEKLNGNDNFGDLDMKETECEDSNEAMSSINAENFLNSCVTSSF
jgi:hypothetical protein